MGNEMAVGSLADYSNPRAGATSGLTDQQDWRKLFSAFTHIVLVANSDEVRIEELQDAQVDPDVWKIEGLDRREDCLKMVAAARRGGRTKVGCIILGRGEDDRKVREWLTTAASVPGFIGFAVGRTVFWEPLIGWRDKKITPEDTVAEIARRYRQFVSIFEPAHVA